MAQQGKDIPVTIGYVVSPENHVLMMFSMPMAANRMTVEQTRAMITQLQECIQMIEQRQKQAS